MTISPSGSASRLAAQLRATAVCVFFAALCPEVSAQHETRLHQDFSIDLPLVEYQSVHYRAELVYNGTQWLLAAADPVFPQFTSAEYLTGTLTGDILQLPCVKFGDQRYTARLQLVPGADIRFALQSYALAPGCRIAASPTGAAFDGDGMVDASTGAVTTGNVTITLPDNALLDAINLAVADTALPAALPAGLTLADSPLRIDISGTDQQRINAPLQIAVDYDDTGMANEASMLVLHYNGSEYEPLRIISHDTVANTLTFESRDFSTFVLATAGSTLPTTYNTGFVPAQDGWNIENFGTSFSGGGNSLGMSGYAAWYFVNGAGRLHDRYSEEVAHIAAVRVQLAQSLTWAAHSWREGQELAPAMLGRTLKAYLALLHEPLVLLMGNGGYPEHAVVVYGYDATGFLIHDVDTEGSAARLSFNGSTFGTYAGYDTFGYASVASLGRSEDFAALAAEADAGFVQSDSIIIDTPAEGATITTASAQVSGRLTGDLVGVDSLYLEVRGIGRRIPVNADGTFSNVIEVSSGENTLVFIAGTDVDEQSNWYADAATLIRTIDAEIGESRLLVTLTWAQNNTDVDLYITEPGGESMWYANKRTSNGLELDIDDLNGFGPEHGTLESGSTATALPGLYRVRVHYYSDHGTDAPVTGTVSIVVNEGTPNQLLRTFDFSISEEDAINDEPDGTGPSWEDIAVVDVINGTITAL